MLSGSAWLLDPVSFHAEFDQLFSGLTDDDGLARFRDRVIDLWNSPDDRTSTYIGTLRTHTPDEWAEGFEERHLSEWYRIVMADHLVPARGWADPTALKDDLPDLGWPPSEARRLTWGRELSELAQQYAIEDTAMALTIVMRVGNKGWLSQDDVAAWIHQFRTMDREWFRGRRHLVPLVEDTFEVLCGAAAHTDRVLLLTNP